MTNPGQLTPLDEDLARVRRQEIYEQADVEDDRVLREAEEAEEEVEDAREFAEDDDH
jgi:hypothetical protein